MSCLSVLCEVGVTSNTRAPRGRPGRARRASHASPCDGRVVSGDWCVRMSLVSEVRSIAETRRAETQCCNVKGPILRLFNDFALLGHVGRRGVKHVCIVSYFYADDST